MYRYINFRHSLVASVLMIASVLMSAYPVYAAENNSAMDKCVQSEALGADISETIGELKKRCRNKLAEGDMETGETVLGRRMRLTEQAYDNPFVVSAYKPNYILLFAHNDEPNEAPFALQFPNEDTSLDNTEVKFQISAKFPLFVDLFDGRGNVFFAYTNRSFWQLYNENSAPFRETNHEPEIILSLKSDWKLFGLTNRLVNLGFVHQSNGRGGTLSRSWNRIYASFILEKENFVMEFKPWYRISEDEADDDNPDIEDYMGNFELTGVYKKGRNTFSVMVRNNLESDDNRGAIQVDWVFPLFKHLSGYVQYFSGYGESMIDYNYDQESIGIGLALSGWL